MDIFSIRSLLYVPASSEKMTDKAFERPCDAVILDLEDAVHADMKVAARERACAMAARPAPKPCIVRANPVATATGVRDLLALAEAGPDAIILTKAREADVVTADTILTAVEEETGREPGGIKLIVLAEIAYTILRLDAIIRSSPRVVAVQAGGEDFTRDMGTRRTAEGAELAYMRNQIALACKANAIAALDTPFTDFRDDEALRRDVETCKAIGFTGKTAIHPAQLEIINAGFTPDAGEVEEARRIVEAFARSERDKLGACQLDGKMLDAPVVERAKNLLARAGRF